MDHQEIMSGSLKYSINLQMLLSSCLGTILVCSLSLDEGKTYIYLVQGYFGAKHFLLVPDLKRKVKNSRFLSTKIFPFFNFDGHWTMGVTRGGQGGAPAPPWNLNFPLYVLVLA